MKEKEVLNRGNMLWTSMRMMMPEQVEEIRKMRYSPKEYVMPEIDESQLEYFNYILQEAMEVGKPVIVKYATKYSPEQFCGFVEKINPYEKFMDLHNGKTRKRVRFDQIINVDWP